MPRRIFVYGSGGAVEVTSPESIALCDEISADAQSRTEPLEFGLPTNRSEWKSVTRWPLHAESVACCDAEDVSREQKLLAENGVKTDYDADFRPILTSAAHLKAHYRAIGHAQPNAGYGDPEPLNYHSGIKRCDTTNPSHRSERLEKARQSLIEKEYRLFGQRVSNI